MIVSSDHGAAPQRIWRRRTRGWRMPPGAVYVGRPSRWGNWLQGPDAAEGFAAALAERERGATVAAEAAAYPSLVEIRAQLAGRDLACWCRPGRPCHADVLLRLANDPVAGQPMEARTR